MSVQSLDIISVNLWQILISLANLLIITFILKRFLFKRVQAVLTARQEQVSKIYGEAEESRNAAVSMKQEYEARLASAREEADGLVRTAVGIASKVVEREIQPKDHEAFVDEFIRNVGDEA